MKAINKEMFLACFASSVFLGDLCGLISRFNRKARKGFRKEREEIEISNLDSHK